MLPSSPWDRSDLLHMAGEGTVSLSLAVHCGTVDTHAEKTVRTEWNQFQPLHVPAVFACRRRAATNLSPDAALASGGICCFSN